MSSPKPAVEWAAAFTPHLDTLVTRVAAFGTNPTVIIDGPSGAGKSTVADYLALSLPQNPAIQLVRLDDIYPGWGGLEAAASVAQNLLVARSRGEVGSWQRYDWASSSLTTWHDIDPERPLILEGCGSLGSRGADAMPSTSLRVWVTVAEDIRRARALSRGGEDFESHWDQWDEQFATRVGRENPERFANIILAASE